MSSQKNETFIYYNNQEIGYKFFYRDYNVRPHIEVLLTIILSGHPKSLMLLVEKADKAEWYSLYSVDNDADLLQAWNEYCKNNPDIIKKLKLNCVVDAYVAIQEEIARITNKQKLILNDLVKYSFAKAGGAISDEELSEKKPKIDILLSL